MRAGAVAGQLGLEERAEEERVRPGSSSARGAPSSSWAPKTTPAALELVDERGRDPVGAVVALQALSTPAISAISVPGV